MNLEQLPEWFTFQIIDLPTERVVRLIRKFDDETIIVYIDPSAHLFDEQPKLPQDDEELLAGIPMVVHVSKDDDGLCLEFGVNAFAAEIVIDSLVVQQPLEPKYPYQGPDFEYVLIHRRFLYIYTYIYIYLFIYEIENCYVTEFWGFMQ